jgi:Uma2 family endonuclease
MNVSALLDRLGGIPLDRLVTPPAPGSATVADVIAAGKPARELAEGTLIRRPPDCYVAFFIPHLLSPLMDFIRGPNLGILTGALAPLEILPGAVRVPDLAFTPWSRLPGGRIPREPVAAVVPELVVNCVRTGNTPGEMTRKRGEYFRAGVRLVWEIDPRARAVRASTSEAAFTDLTAADALDGAPALPGFTLPLSQLFAELDRHG